QPLRQHVLPQRKIKQATATVLRLTLDLHRQATGGEHQIVGQVADELEVCIAEGQGERIAIFLPEFLHAQVITLNGRFAAIAAQIGQSPLELRAGTCDLYRRNVSLDTESGLQPEFCESLRLQPEAPGERDSLFDRDDL